MIALFEVSSETFGMSPDTAYINDSFSYKNWLNVNSQQVDIRYTTINSNKMYKSIKDLILDINYDYTESSTDIIAIGSIEFTERFLGKQIKPINIPIQLRSQNYTHRFVNYANVGDIESYYDQYNSLFIKLSSRCKSDITGVYNKSSFLSLIKTIQDKTLFISEVINIVAEWRVFVLDNKIIDIRQYSGDFRSRPNIDIVEQMVSDYLDSPRAYTLDIALDNKNNTVIIEVHNFLSCGLYGFESLRYLSKMATLAFNYELNN